MVLDLLTDPSLRALLRGADVVDLQWEEYGRLAPLVKMLSPGSLITCMFHDVNDQRATRRLHAADTTSIKKARRQLRQVQRAERRLTARLDAAFVLSEKDKKVLTSVAPGAPTRVVPPPLADSSIPMVDTEHREAAVGFVSALGRQENRDAAHRLVHSVWPLIHQALPDARLILVGGGLDLSTKAGFLEVPGVEVTGFVDDLDAQYRRFSATLSPISTGAGVKFKILESIIRGLPTITTSVGIEGIEPDLAEAVGDDDAELARATIAALQDTDAPKRARAASAQARQLYSRERFHQEYQAAFR
ncbi:glycosyltransferase family 4 protein [Brachybacterium aquaticum]|uniref:glycosyltransferase family 4 protein n=1 Tax=Brachybacterium aquaticum TaxID=1432564 RepID=UPI001C88CE9B|nr:glycosyltransferase family 4 protein [Brachybacterium aquaticum]